MKKKGLIIFFMTIAFLVIIVDYFFFGQREYVVKGDTVQEYPDKWKNIISQSVNASVIVVNIDGKRYNSTDTSIYMSEDMELMCKIEHISEMFVCAANRYSDGTIKIVRGEDTLIINNADIGVTRNGEVSDENIVVIENNKGTFTSLSAIAKFFSYDYNWDPGSNQINIVNNDPNMSTLPHYYNYEEEGRINIAKNQGHFGTCWSFAALSALESSLLPAEVFDFSEDHMTLNNSYNLRQQDGGDYQMAIAYLTAWQGPVLEADDPYGDGVTNSDLKAVKHVQEVQVIPVKQFEKIKKMILLYGGVQSSLYAANTNSRLVDSGYYSNKNNSYCYNGDAVPNHDIVIIGWDDDYPKEKFNVDVEGDGAFICRNSWGESFGTNGDFYVSYYDSNIGNYNVSYTKVENTDNYNNIYQSDLCGWVGQVGYGREDAYFANVYTSKDKEDLKAVGFYATDVDTEYSVYVCENFENMGSLSRRGDPIVTGKFENPGFYTVNLDTTIHLNKGQRYAIIVKVKTPNSERPVAIEFNNDYTTETVDITDGEGYVSLKGIEWENTESKHLCNVCLKAYTVDTEE